MNEYKTYEVVFLGAMFVAILATPLVIRLARKLNLVDLPGLRKVHGAAIPRIGGIAILLAMLCLTLPVLWLNNLIGRTFREDGAQVIAILAGGTFMFLVGLIDDIRGVRARVKFLAQILAAVAVCLCGVRIDHLVVGEWFTLDLGWVSWPLTILWIVGVTNALNLIDGLDGLAAGISGITCLMLAVFALYMNLAVTATLMLALLGSLVGFLFLNFNPARIFMGDCGSLLIGFVLAAVSVRSAGRAETAVGLLLPFLAMGIPILDTLFSMLRRMLQRRGIFSPDRGHIHHRLLAMGLRQHQVAMLVYAATLIVSGLGLFMMFLHTHGQAVVAIFLSVLAVLVLMFRAVGAVRIKEALAAWRRNANIARESREQHRNFDDMQLLLCEAKTFDQWWTALCQAAEELGFVRLSLSLTNRDGTSRKLLWRQPGQELPAHQKITVAVPVRQRRQGGPLKAEIDVFLNGSVESAGRRVSLFGRLMDEHSVAELPLNRRLADAAAEPVAPVQAPQP